MSLSDHHTLLAGIPLGPGVYRFLDEAGQVLYVGKAKNLRRRVSSYFSRSLNRRQQVMVDQVADIEVTVTSTEGEALLLEGNLIKSLRPRFNVVLRDDKSYPYIYLSTQEPFPRLAFYRGARTGSGRYFGPYPSASAVRETLQLLQKLFPVRQCEDGFFRNRSRPCLQYQIGRCSGPCVGLIDAESYAADVERTAKFLSGRADEVNEELAMAMDRASAALDFERAAVMRDRIQTLRRIQERQHVAGERGDLDIIATAHGGGRFCVLVFFIRAGRNLGSKTFFPQAPPETDEATLVSGFIAQFYADKPIPAEIVLTTAPNDQPLLEQGLAQRAGRRVAIKTRVRAERARWLDLARGNARVALESRLGSQADYQRRLDALRDALQLAERPQRIECFDVSHTAGERTVASCVVFNGEGPCPSAYRRFNIDHVTAGDDYAAMHQALTRRYTRAKQSEHPLPDLLLIDGGRGQLNRAIEALEALGIGGITMVGIAKGPDRRPGQEQLWLSDRDTAIILPSDSPAIYLIQQVRDEAHRFAITGHRQRRAKARTTSVLEAVPGIGPKRRQHLLRKFGGLQGLRRAGTDDIAKVDGIGRKLARQIYDALHRDQGG